MKFNVLVLVTLMGLLGGCGQPEPAQPPTVSKPKAPAAPPISATPAPPDAPPPPAPTAPTTAAPAPGGPAQAGVGVPTAGPGTDPLFYFRRDDTGRVRTDLEALQEAAIAYSRKVGISESADQPVWANLTDLAQLVQVGMLKALPAAPEGKKYVVEPKTHKVSLVNK